MTPAAGEGRPKSWKGLGSLEILERPGVTRNPGTRCGSNPVDCGGRCEELQDFRGSSPAAGEGRPFQDFEGGPAAARTPRATRQCQPGLTTDPSGVGLSRIFGGRPPQATHLVQGTAPGFRPRARGPAGAWEYPIRLGPNRFVFVSGRGHHGCCVTTRCYLRQWIEDPRHGVDGSEGSGGAGYPVALRRTGPFCMPGGRSGPPHQGVLTHRDHGECAGRGRRGPPERGC